ncbi:adenosylhomocysteinase [Promicromonospora sp. NPDC090134]|uniref:adenosylhomocysteinase n=1 Tax=Promicromonospora sp. NPDC090134 TaxID=3364408 RepID=UPI0038016570
MSSSSIEPAPVPPMPPTGHPAIDWAARHMPLLDSSFAEIGPVFDGLHVGVSIHVEPKTAVLCQRLLAAGARITITGNIGTTQPGTVDALRGIGATVLGSRDDTPAERAGHLERILAAEPDLILDNGGDLITRLTQGAPRSPRFLGATEETTTGGNRLRQLASPPDFPVVVINDSRLKLLVENELGVGQSIVQGFMNATNLMLPGARTGVVGYGPCGKGVADTLRSLGARVTVAELDPFRALDAVMRGHQVAGLPDLLATSDVVFLATGARNVIAAGQLSFLRDGAVLAGVGHEGMEIDRDALAAATAEIVQLSAAGDDRDARVVYRLRDGREIVLLHDTHMLNLTAASGNPIQAMDLGFSLQARSLAMIAAGAVGPGVSAVPEPVDRVLATSLVRVLSERS